MEDLERDNYFLSKLYERIQDYKIISENILYECVDSRISDEEKKRILKRKKTIDKEIDRLYFYYLKYNEFIVEIRSLMEQYMSCKSSEEKNSILELINRYKKEKQKIYRKFSEVLGLVSSPGIMKKSL